MMLAQTINTVESSREEFAFPGPTFRAGTVLMNCKPGESARRISKIVEFLGGAIAPIQFDAEIKGTAPCLITDAETVSQMGEAAWTQLGDFASNVLIFGFTPGSHSRLLNTLTSNSLSGVKLLSAGTRKLAVTSEAPALCRQLSGLATDLMVSRDLPVFSGDDNSTPRLPVFTVDGNPAFVRMPTEAGAIFLLAGNEIPELDAPVFHGLAAVDFLPGLAPWFMFLRASLGAALWEANEPLACFIIDDPLLKPRYGFLEYDRLLQAAERENFCVSLAFIPSNFKRSESGTAKLFASHPERLSLCVHGCDHTWAEFGVSDEAVLRAQAERALARMERHQTLSGVPFDSVMVFPQGIFSRVAMKALRDSGGYLAAVNSTPCPVDAGEDVPILRELLEPATTRFADFPLFTRRYPHNPAALRFDLFLGRPALMVEHHGYFRDGYDSLSCTVRQLAKSEPGLRWANLGALCARSFWRRINNQGEIEARFFTNRFWFKNDSGAAQNYVVSRRTGGDRPEACLVNGRPVSFTTAGEFVQTSVGLHAGETAELRLKYNSPTAQPTPRQGWTYQAKVFTRRRLSEFRDNCVEPAKQKLRKRG